MKLPQPLGQKDEKVISSQKEAEKVTLRQKDFICQDRLSEKAYLLSGVTNILMWLENTVEEEEVQQERPKRVD